MEIAIFEAAGKGVVLLLIMLGLMWGMKRWGISAASRHAWWASGFAVLLLLPLFSAAPSIWQVPVERVSVAGGMLATEGGQRDSGRRAPTAEEVLGTSEEGQWFDVGQGVLFVWLTGLVLLLVRRVVSSLALRGLARNSREIGQREWKGRWAVSILASPEAQVPMTWGLWHPNILLPMEQAGWTAERREAVLRHEMGHVQRHDCAVRWMIDLGAMFHWWNPLVWLTRREAFLAQEEACDNLVLLGETDPAFYASQLVEAAKKLQKPPTGAMAMAQPSTLRSRVQAILDPARSRRSAGKWMWALCGAAFGGFAMDIGGAGLAVADEGEQGQYLMEARFFQVNELGERLVVEAREVAVKEGVMTAVMSEDQAEAMLGQMESLRADILSAPRVVTLDGKEARIEIGGGDKESIPQLALSVMPRAIPDSSRTALEWQVEWRTEKDGKNLQMTGKENLASGESIWTRVSSDGEQFMALIRLARLGEEQAASPSTTMEDLSEIVISASYQGVPLSDVLASLAEHSKETPNGRTAGVNVVLEAPSETKALPITMDLKHVTLKMAYEYVANLSGLNVRFENDRVILTAPSE